MYFFRIKISSFDDEEKTLYIVPEQNTDEKGVPFDEKMVTQTAEYKAFVKETATNMVDGEYTEYKTDTASDSITKEQFAELEASGKLTVIESNSFSIKLGGKSSKIGSKLDLKTILIIGAIAVVGIVALILTFALDSGNNAAAETTETTETTEIPVLVSETTTTAETELTDISTEDTLADTTELPVESVTEEEIVDIPAETTSEPTEEETESGYTSRGYSGGSSSGGRVSGGSASTENKSYTISFNLNGGTGTLDSITSEAGQYVVLPSAADASKTVSKKGCKLIGFSDNTDILYPLYHYKMPYENVTLFAVWEPDTFIVTYNSNGGTGTLSRAEVKYGADVPLPTDISIYKEGLYLSGWAKSDSDNPLKTLRMPAENITLYAIWREKPPTARITLHYDDKIQIIEEEIGTDLNMLDSFGIFKDGYAVEGWYLENSPVKVESLHISEDCDVYAKWKGATYITVTIDKSYLNANPEQHKLQLDITGAAKLKLPKVDDKNDLYSHVEGCTYGFSDRPQTGDYGTIKYFGDTEYSFTKDTTLYRVLNEYGGGAGTADEPYIISYYDQLLRLSEQKAKGYFIQTEDISFPSNIERIPIDTIKIGRGFENKHYNFFVYDGQGFTIKGISDEGGLFGNIAGAEIKNVVIDGANIKAGGYENVGVLCNSVISYSFKSSDEAQTYTMGNSKFTNCTVKNSKIDGTGARNLGGIVGYGGIITYCRAEQIAVNGGDNVGGIVGNACIVNGCLANGIAASGEIKSAGGIAGTAYGTEIFDNSDKSYLSGGTVIGCGVRTFTSKAVNSGGIVGTAAADTSSAFIKSCYAANIYLNGTNNGGIAGADGEYKGHRIAYCLVDNTNGYPVIGGNNVRSVSKTMVLSVPADSGLTVDGVLSVLNAAGSGFDKWERSENINGGYPYPSKIKF